MPIFQMPQTFLRTFHDTSYSITLHSQADRLYITAEEAESGEVWKGDFSSRFIEDLTGKTGNAKKFSVFEKMLIKGLEGGNGSVVADLLSAQELDSLRVKRPGKLGALTARVGNNKRYLILTYSVEFDKVHYPLPLIYEEREDPKHLKDTVIRLKAQVRDLRSGFSRGDDEALYEENAKLRAQIRDLEEENRHFKQENEELSDQLRVEKVQSAASIRQLQDVNVRLLGELDRVRDEMDTFIQQMEEEQRAQAQLPDAQTLLAMVQDYVQLKTTVKEQKEALERLKLEQ